jgi:hypothetical protein
MTQTQLSFSKPTPAELGLKPGSHADLIYRRLVDDGAITNAEIVRGIGCFNSTGRVSDLRAKLKPFLLDIEARRVDKGLFSYRIRG